MDSALYVVAAAGLFLAGIVKGATGLGYASCALPFLVASVGLRPAMALVLIPAMATNINVALTAGHLQETARRFKSLYLAMVPGIFVGVVLLLWINQQLAVISLGLIIIVYVLLALLKPTLSLNRTLEARLMVPTGFCNGVITGLTGSQVMPLFPYMMALDLAPNQLVQAINLGVILASVALGVGLLATGIMTWSLLLASMIAIIPALVGVRFGTLARAHIPPDKFRLVVLNILFFTGMLLIMR